MEANDFDKFVKVPFGPEEIAPFLRSCQFSVKMRWDEAFGGSAFLSDVNDRR